MGELVNAHRDEHKTLRRKVMGDEPVELGTQTELQNEHDLCRRNCSCRMLSL